MRRCPRKFSGIAGNGGVDLKAPAVDAAGHALASRDALLAQPADDVQTPDAVMAVDDQCDVVRGGLQVLELSWNGAHRNQFGAQNAGDLEFGGLTNVDQEQLFAGCDAELNILGCDFEGQRGFRHAS